MLPALQLRTVFLYSFLCFGCCCILRFGEAWSFRTKSTDATTWQIKAPVDWNRLRFLLVTYGTRGDVQPYIGLCRILMDRGHTCRIATHTCHEEWIRSSGIDFRPLGNDGSMVTEFLQSLTKNGIASYRNLAMLKPMQHFLYGVFVDAYQAALDHSGHADIDVVLGVNWVHVGQHIAEKLRLPYLDVQVFPNTATNAFSLYFFEDWLNTVKWAPPLMRWLNRFTYTMADWTISTVGQIKMVNHFRSHVLHLPVLTGAQLRQRQRSAPMIYGISPHVLTKPSDWSRHVHLVGFWTPAETHHGSVPQELAEFISRNTTSPLVFVGFGSMTAGGAVQTITRELVDKLKAKKRQHWWDRIIPAWLKRRLNWPDYRLIISYPAGSDDLAEWYDDDNIYILQQPVAHSWLFEQVDVVIHHGGAGTLAASLRAGTPSIVKPFLGDQFLWCARVKTLQVGKCVPSRNLRKTPHKIYLALYDVLKNLDHYQEQAQNVQRQLLTEDVPTATWNSIWRELKNIIVTQNNFPNTVTGGKIHPHKQ